MTPKPISLSVSITWPKLVAAAGTIIAAVGTAVWGGAKWGLEDRAAILSRIEAVEVGKAPTTRVDALDVYVHAKGAERDVFAAKVCEKFDAIKEMQIRTDGKVDKLNDKIDAVLLANKRIATAIGGSE